VIHTGLLYLLQFFSRIFYQTPTVHFISITIKLFASIFLLELGNINCCTCHNQHLFIVTSKSKKHGSWSFYPNKENNTEIVYVMWFVVFFFFWDFEELTTRTPSQPKSKQVVNLAIQISTEMKPPTRENKKVEPVKFLQGYLQNLIDIELS
jgi:hypothetical protein